MSAAGQIAVDARYVTSEPTGIGQVCLQLLTGLAGLRERRTLTVLVNRDTRLPAALWEHPTLMFREAPWAPDGLLNQLFLPGLLGRLQVGVLHSLDCFSPLRARQVAQVVTIHDLIPLVCNDLRGLKGRLRPLWKSWLKRQCARADRIIAVSHHSRSELVRLLHVPAHKVQVLHNPVRRWPAIEPIAQFRQRWGLRGQVISYVGRQEPYKNLVGLIRALRVVLETMQDSALRLVVAGRLDSRYPEALREAVRLGVADRVLFTGYLSEASLGALYRTSDAFVFPSLQEGFGLPPVEAMSFGTPVISAVYPAAREVLGEAALYVDARAPRSLAAGILRVLQDQNFARRLGQAGVQQAARYDGRHAARQHLEIYDALLRSVARGPQASSDPVPTVQACRPGC